MSEETGGRRRRDDDDTFVVLVFVTFMVTLVYLLDLAFAKAVFAIFG